ncbi:hypothetical protein BB558_005096 [Smittium angustum]|uniref:Pentacotripeptide-repeat region of PRORP domain-containing protein n=1 Tax=Smittium angustum TaxID=133377 RepID=A0A2U1J1D2_SMIAN|nr:hypothetical protein BB558_005096 [Smittium angustum]
MSFSTHHYRKTTSLLKFLPKLNFHSIPFPRLQNDKNPNINSFDPKPIELTIQALKSVYDSYNFVHQSTKYPLDSETSTNILPEDTKLVKSNYYVEQHSSKVESINELIGSKKSKNITTLNKKLHIHSKSHHNNVNNEKSLHSLWDAHLKETSNPAVLPDTLVIRHLKLLHLIKVYGRNKLWISRIKTLQENLDRILAIDTSLESQTIEEIKLISLRIALQAYAKMGSVAGSETTFNQLKTQFFKESDSSKLKNELMYMIIIYLNSGMLDKAKYAFKTLESLGMRSMSKARKAFISYYTKNNMTTEASTSLDHLRTIYLETHHKLEQHKLQPKNSYNTFVTERLHERYLSTRKNLIISYNMYINMLSANPTVSLEKIEMVQWQLENIPGVFPIVSTFNILIRACLIRNEPYKANILMEKMAKIKLNPDVITFTTWITYCIKSRKWNDLNEILQTMKEFDVKPNQVTELCLLIGKSYRNENDSMRIHYWSIISRLYENSDQKLDSLSKEISTFILSHALKNPLEWADEICAIIRCAKEGKIKDKLVTEALISKIPNVEAIVNLDFVIANLVKSLNNLISDYFNSNPPKTPEPTQTSSTNVYEQKNLNEANEQSKNRDALLKDKYLSEKNTLLLKNNTNPLLDIPKQDASKIWDEFNLDYLVKSAKSLLLNPGKIYSSLFIHLSSSGNGEKALFLHRCATQSGLYRGLESLEYKYSLLNVLLDHREFEESVSTLQDLCKTALFTYGYPISNVSRKLFINYQPENVLPFMYKNSMSYTKKVPNLYSYTALLNNAAESKNMDGVEYIWNSMLDSGISPDSIAHLKRIKAYSLSEKHDDVIAKYWEMINSNIAPLSHTLDFVMKSLYLKLDLANAIKILHNAVTKHFVSPNTLAINYLFQLLLKTQKNDSGLLAAFSIFEPMLAHKSKSIVTERALDVTSSFIKKRFLDTNLSFEFANLKLKEFQTNRPLDQAESMIYWVTNSYLQHQPPSIDTLNQERNYVQAMNTNAGYVESNEQLDYQSMMLEVTQLFQRNVELMQLDSKEQMKILTKSKTSLKTANALPPPPNLTTFTVIMRFALTQQKYEIVKYFYNIFNEYKSLYKWNRANNPRLFGYALVSFTELGETENAKRVWKKMCEEGYILDEHTLSFNDNVNFYLEMTMKKL